MKPPRSAMPVRPDTDNLSQQNMNFFSFFIVILQFLRPKTFKKLLQSSLHTHTHTHTHTQTLFLALSLCSLRTVSLCSFSIRTIIGTHQNAPRIWQNILKNPLTPIANLARTVSDTKNDQK